MEEIVYYVKKAFQWIKNLITKVINGLVNFFSHVVGWFKSLYLNQQTDIPFVINAKSPEFKEMLQKAPQKNVGIFQGVYNEQTEEITHHEYIAADALDSQTKNVLGSESMVVLQ